MTVRRIASTLVVLMAFVALPPLSAQTSWKNGGDLLRLYRLACSHSTPPDSP